MCLPEEWRNGLQQDSSEFGSFILNTLDSAFQSTFILQRDRILKFNAKTEEDMDISLLLDSTGRSAHTVYLSPCSG